MADEHGKLLDHLQLATHWSEPSAQNMSTDETKHATRTLTGLPSLVTL